MKKNRLLLFLLVLILASCATSEHFKLRIELPRKTAFSSDPYEEIVITDFIISEERKDFDLNKDLKEYFQPELEQNFKKKVSLENIALEQVDIFKDEEFWKNLPRDLKKAIYFTGSAQYSSETRKSLLRTERRRHEDPFQSQPRLAQRNFYTLQIELFLIDAGSGKILYQRKFKETKSFKNPNQTSHFAFFDLVSQVKDKLFRNIFGTVQLQERYLITH